MGVEEWSSDKDVLYDENPTMYLPNYVEANSYINKGTDKSRLYLRLYTTMFVWLDCKRKKGNQDNFWQPINFNGFNNQLDKFEFRIAKILEKEVKDKQFGWWN
jgi:hypothetical protein